MKCELWGRGYFGEKSISHIVKLSIIVFFKFLIWLDRSLITPVHLRLTQHVKDTILSFQLFVCLSVCRVVLLPLQLCIIMLHAAVSL